MNQEVDEKYHLVHTVGTGVIEGMAIDASGAFTFVNMDLHTRLEDGREITGRFALPDAEAAERLASSLQKAAQAWREKTGG